MALNSFNSFNKLGGLNKLKCFSSGGQEQMTPEELLMIAKSRGGAVGEVAEELVHPERSMLSTIGNGFKKAFGGFVDMISIPSEVVAGIISKDYTVGEAIDQNKRVTDAIFGDKNIFNKEGEATTMQKIGNFIVRTPIDILTDPLTYLTFGSSAGILGLKSLPKVTLGLKAIEGAGLATQAAKKGGVLTKALSAEGADLLKFTKNLQRQITGTMSAENLITLTKTGENLKAGLLKRGVTQETLDFTEKELKDLLKATVEAPLQPDWAKKAVSNLIDHNPALTKTMLDEGGIKMFGKTILSGQRISATMGMIPGMNMLDNFTQPMRNSVNALFDPAIVKVGDEFVRLPEEYVGFRQQLKDIGESLNVDAFRNMSNVQKQLNLNKDEWRLVMDAMSIRKMPADSRLAKAYTTMLDLDEANLEMLKKAGVPIHNLENHTGLIFVGEDTRRVIKNSQFSQKIGAAQEAAHAKFIEQTTVSVADEVPELTKYAEEFPDSEIGKALGKNSITPESSISKAKASGQSFDEWVNKESFNPNSRLEYHLSDNPNLVGGKTFAEQIKPSNIGERGFAGKEENIGQIFSTKNPQQWSAQLNFEGNKKPQYVYLVEVKNPAKVDIMDDLPHQSINSPQDVKILKKVGGQEAIENPSIMETAKRSQLKAEWDGVGKTIKEGGVQSPQEIGFAIGRELDQKV